MANPAENKISEALAAYDFVGEVVGTVRFGKGHINDTFCVYTQTEEGDCVRYILQRMSAAAFQHPDQLMRNIVGITDYLRGVIEKNGGDGARETMTVLRTKTGDTFFTDSERRTARGACTRLLRGRAVCSQPKRQSCFTLRPRRSAGSSGC